MASRTPDFTLAKDGVHGPAWLARVGHKGNPKPVDFDAASTAAAALEKKARALVQ